jgi:hypothetical protein
MFSINFSHRFAERFGPNNQSTSRTFSDPYLTQIGQQRQLMYQPGQHLVKIAAVQNISQQSQNYQQRFNPVQQSGQVQTGYSRPINASGSQNVTWQPVIQQNMQNSQQPKQQNSSHIQYSSAGSPVYPEFSAHSSSLVQQQNLLVTFQGGGQHFLKPPLQQGQYAMQPGYFSPFTQQQDVVPWQQYGQQGHINNFSQYDQGTSQNGQPVSLPQEQQHLQQGLALQPQVFKPCTTSSLSSQQPQQNFSSSTHGQDQVFKSALQQQSVKKQHQPVTQAYQGENRFPGNYQQGQHRPKGLIIPSLPPPYIFRIQGIRF